MDNPHVEPTEVVDQFWRRIQARDWDGLGELLAPDVVLEWPNAHLRIRGRANFVEFNRTYPEGWAIEVLRLVAEGPIVVSEVRVPHPTVGPPDPEEYVTTSAAAVLVARIPWLDASALPVLAGFLTIMGMDPATRKPLSRFREGILPSPLTYEVET